MRRPGRRNARASNPRNIASILRALGATADFDPSFGATDDGTTSTWIDRIGGYTVASTSQATRMTYSASLAGLNGRPGWTGVAANSTRLVTANGTLSGLIDASQPLTVYSARKWASGTGTVWAGGSTANGHVMSVRCSTSGEALAQRYDGANTAHTGSVLSGTALTIDSMVYTGSALAMWSNSAATIASAANVRAPVCDRFSIGGRIIGGAWEAFHDGLIGRVVVFLGAHADDQRVYIQNLLKYHYGVT